MQVHPFPEMHCHRRLQPDQDLKGTRQLQRSRERRKLASNLQTDSVLWPEKTSSPEVGIPNFLHPIEDHLPASNGARKSRRRWTGEVGAWMEVMARFGRVRESEMRDDEEMATKVDLETIIRTLGDPVQRPDRFGL